MYSPDLFLLTFAFQAVESIQAEDESAKLCKRRIEHLKEHSSDQPAAANMWKKKRMDRMMVEHLLRCGYYNTAVKLARQSGIEVGNVCYKMVLKRKLVNTNKLLQLCSSFFTNQCLCYYCLSIGISRAEYVLLMQKYDLCDVFNKLKLKAELSVSNEVLLDKLLAF